MIFSDSRDPNRVPKTPYKKPWSRFSLHFTQPRQDVANNLPALKP